MPRELDHVWFWRSRLPERKGEQCRVVVRGTLNSVLVEFADGKRVVTSRWAVRPSTVKIRAFPDEPAGDLTHPDHEGRSGPQKGVG